MNIPIFASEYQLGAWEFLNGRTNLETIYLLSFHLPKMRDEGIVVVINWHHRGEGGADVGDE